MEHITRDEAFQLLKKYNKDPFHIQHALTVEAVMKWYADGLTGLIWAAVLMRPSKSTKDMTLQAMAASEDEINAEMAAEQ